MTEEEKKERRREQNRRAARRHRIKYGITSRGKKITEEERERRSRPKTEEEKKQRTKRRGLKAALKYRAKHPEKVKKERERWKSLNEKTKEVAENHGTEWVEQDDEIVLSHSIQESIEILGRTYYAILARRRKLRQRKN